MFEIFTDINSEQVLSGLKYQDQQMSYYADGSDQCSKHLESKIEIK